MARVGAVVCHGVAGSGAGSRAEYLVPGVVGQAVAIDVAAHHDDARLAAAALAGESLGVEKGVAQHGKVGLTGDIVDRVVKSHGDIAAK